jgi:PAS domain S-box-containing protein
MYIQVGFIGLLIAATMWYALSTSSRIANQYTPLVDAVKEIKLRAAVGHLWFEEIIAGDRAEDISAVWRHLDLATWYAQAMLEGGTKNNITYVPLDDQELRQDISELLETVIAFRAIAEERFADVGRSEIGSTIDQRFDAVFKSLFNQIDSIEADLQEVMSRDVRRSQIVQKGLLLLCVLLTVVIGVTLHRFQRHQSVDVERLKAFNQQLMASEQQLKAANQQLRAHEQQLRAANQQLIASEQQLKASNQQLTANEKQLKDSNLQLSVNEQQLTAAFQQLTAGEQQLRASHQQLKESQQKLALHVQNTPLGVIQWDPEFEIVEWNKGAEKIFGYTAEEVIGKHGAGLIVPESAKEAVNRVYRDLIAQKGGSRSINENFTKDNETLICDWYNTPLISEDGTTMGIASLVMDVTERKLAEKALAQSEAQYRSTVENLLVGVVVHDSDSSILLSNARASSILGLTPDQMAGKEAVDPTWRFVHEDSSAMKIQDYPVSKVIATGKPISGYIVGIIRPDKDHVTWVNVSAIPLLSSDRELDRIIINFLDITETRRLQKLESRAARLETAGTIAGQVAHDFNNLLAPIMAYPEFIHDELPHDHKAHAYLDAIESAAQKIANINQDLLTMGRRGYYNQEVLDLNRIVLQAAQEMETRTKTVKVEVLLCEGLMNIKGGGAQIHRILTNLLMNAHDAMLDMGQVTIKTENYYADDTSVVFGRVPKGEYVKLTVTDNGCGIPESIIQHILDPFFSTKTTDKRTGSGLGLSVVDAVMKDHDGYLDLNSTVGQGTSFYLYFPITREDVGDDDPELPTGGTETILVIDDDSIQREVSSQLLTKLGYTVQSVESGERAVEFIRDNPQDLLILDMVMPGGIDGAETYRRILEVSPSQKAIILSGFSESDRVIEAQTMGAGAFVRKPVTKNGIAAAVRTELDRPVTIPKS